MKRIVFFSFVSTFSQALAITAILILLTVSFVVVGLTKKVVIINNSFEGVQLVIVILVIKA